MLKQKKKWQRASYKIRKAKQIYYESIFNVSNHLNSTIRTTVRYHYSLTRLAKLKKVNSKETITKYKIPVFIRMFIGALFEKLEKNPNVPQQETD